MRRSRSATAPTTSPCCSPPDLASPIAPSPSSPHRRTRSADRLLRHLDDDIAGGEPALGGSRAGVDPGDDHALDAVLDLEALAQVVGEIGDVKPEHALDRGLLLGRLLALGERRLFLALLQPADLDGPRLFFSLAAEDDLDA